MKNKVVVIDDPISSLDSSVLFVVNTLVRILLNNCLEEEYGVEQILILTHNVYFYKEITYTGSGKQWSATITLFGIIKKLDNVSEFVEYASNPNILRTVVG